MTSPPGTEAVFVAPAAAAPLRGRTLWRIAGLALIAALLLLWPQFVHDEFLYHVGTLLCLYAIGATSVHLIIRTGHISLGQAAFMGIGAYTCVLSVMQLGLPWWLGAIFGILVSSLLGLAVAPIFLRLTGKYFVLVTFLFGEIVRMVLSESVSITGGANGIANIPPPFAWAVSKSNYYYLALAAAALCVGFSARLLSSDLGRVMGAVRASDRLAEVAGIPVVRIKVIVFTIASGMIGLQGVLQAHYLRYIEPQTFASTESLNFVVMNVIGGMQALAGPLLGSVFVVVLPELLRQYVMLQRVLFGILLIVVMAAMPGGLIELWQRVMGLVVQSRLAQRT